MMSLPSSVLFCCNHNSVRSPMAEGLMKIHIGNKIYVQSAGVASDREIDGFSISVCNEVGVHLIQHKARSFVEMEGTRRRSKWLRPDYSTLTCSRTNCSGNNHE